MNELLACNANELPFRILQGFLSAGALPPYEIRKTICHLEHEMLKAVASGEYEAIDFPLRHQFAPGVYIRSIFLPAKTLVIGAIHRHSHWQSISEGKVTVLTEQNGCETLEAPYESVAAVGVKRAIYVHSDTVWTTVHPTTETNPDVIRKAVTTESYTQLGWDDPMPSILALEGVL